MLILGAYLDGEVEEVQIPVRARNTVLVRDSHGYRGQTVCHDRHRGTVGDVGEGRCSVARPAMRVGRQEGLSLGVGRRSTEASHIVLRHLDGIVFILFLVHDCGGSTLSLGQDCSGGGRDGTRQLYGQWQYERASGLVMTRQEKKGYDSAIVNTKTLAGVQTAEREGVGRGGGSWEGCSWQRNWTGERDK